MVYLDYAADTPADARVLQAFCEAAKEYPGNPNSPHSAGFAAGKRLEEATAGIAALLGVRENELIHTSGASESNNLAIKGAALQYAKFGRHIITTQLEHSSVNGAMAYLKDQGFEIEYAELLPNGQVDPDSLKTLLRQDTILLSVAAVDSEVGIRQSLDKIAELLKKFPRCVFHTDATQAVGKIPVSFEGVGLASFAPHKFYGLNGSGLLFKREGIELAPQIHGGISATPYRSGTPAVALTAASAKALELCIPKIVERYEYVSALNRTLREAFGKTPGVVVNSTEVSVPHILNIGIPGVKTEALQRALDERGICVSTKSACCAPNTVSRPVYALTRDRRLALSTLRISLSHLTTQEELVYFLQCFGECLKQCRG